MRRPDAITPRLIGIAGGSGSGKTWLADRLSRVFKNRAVLISQDWYYRDQAGLSRAAELKLSADELARIEQAAPADAVAGTRYMPAVMAHMDLVVSVDNALAHLAGALARPTWILLPFSADWRWLQDRLDSPWYPTVRLFRQPEFGDWNTVMQEVAAAVQDFRGES